MTVILIQRIGIDVDDDGEQLGDGAALVDLAVLQCSLQLPFVPFPGLCIELRGETLAVEQVTWIPGRRELVCDAEPIWAQTQEAADDIVRRLVGEGFSPFDQNHRETDVH